MTEAKKINNAEYFRITTRNRELEEENHEYYKEILKLNDEREQVEQLFREFCARIVSQCVQKLGEEKVSQCYILAIRDVLALAQYALELHELDWVESTEKLLQRLDYYTGKEK